MEKAKKANHTAAQRWRRTVADECSPEQAQASLDRWCALRGDTRLRPTSDGDRPPGRHARRASRWARRRVCLRDAG